MAKGKLNLKVKSRLLSGPSKKQLKDSISSEEKIIIIKRQEERDRYKSYLTNCTIECCIPSDAAFHKLIKYMKSEGFDLISWTQKSGRKSQIDILKLSGIKKEESKLEENHPYFFQ
jgi:hypothetical protein